MGRPSMESEKPILTTDPNSNRTSTRLSSYSKSPSDVPSDRTNASMANGDSRGLDFKGYATSLDRLDDKRLQQQRYVVSPQKEGDMEKLALVGKVQKALERRYANQDAVMKPKKLSEKPVSTSA